MSVNPKDKWVLVIEDDYDDEVLTRRAFTTFAREETIKVARDGIAALDLLKDWNIPVLVILDLKLPRLSGVDVLLAIRDDARLSTIPVVVLTSSKELSDIGACYELGCNAYVEKPLDFEEFMSTLSKVLDFWLRVNLTLPPERLAATEEASDEEILTDLVPN